MRSTFAFGFVLFLLLVGIVTGLNSFSTVNPGEKGVLVAFGQVQNEVEPGVFPKIPFFTTIETISTRDGLATFPGLTAYSRDLQTATVSNISITYRVDPAKVTEVYLKYGSLERMVEQLLNRPVGAYLEQTFGQYNATKAVQEREALGADFAARIKTAAEGTPLIISSVNVENFSFPDEYEANINAQMAATVRAVEATETAKKTVIEANATADSQLAIATANAKSIELLGNAEANAIKAKGDALRENPALVALTTAERWNGILPTTMLPGGTTPMLNLGALTQ